MVAAVFALTLLAGSAVPSVPPPAVASPTIRVRIRVNTGAVEKHVPFADLVRNVRAIWKPYADMVFVDDADLDGDEYDDDVQLVVSDRPASAASGASALGWITFIGPRQPVNFVTVSVASARTLMTHDTWMGRRFDDLPPALRRQFVTRAVSWSAAHEIGHYLLRTGEHAAGGLMKAAVTAAEVMRNDRDWVRLEPQHIAALRLRAAHAGLRTRSEIKVPF
ncbi:MAG: hypothetical protein ABJA98_32460 [Acidobacteriota bacterium]